MNRYGVTVNNHKEQIENASSAHTAVDRAMTRFVESEFKPCATIKVRFVGKVELCYDIVADVPFDYGENGKGTKRETVSKGWDFRGNADIEVARLKAAHPDWKFVRSVSREVKA